MRRLLLLAALILLCALPALGQPTSMGANECLCSPASGPGAAKFRAIGPYLPYSLDGFSRWSTTIGGTGPWQVNGGIFFTSNGGGGFQFKDPGGDGIAFTSAGGGIDFTDFGNGFLFNSLNTLSPGSAGSDFTVEGDWIELDTTSGQASTAPHDRHILIHSATGPITLDASSGAGSVSLKAGTGGITLSAASLPAHGPVIGEGASHAASPGPGIAGAVLGSGGASADPAWVVTPIIVGVGNTAGRPGTCAAATASAVSAYLDTQVPAMCYCVSANVWKCASLS